MSHAPSDAMLAGQRLMVGVDGTFLDADLKYLIRDMGVSGIILFKKNIEAPAQLREMIQSVQRYAAACKRDPVFVAVDQEGGVVARLRKPFFTEFPGNPHIKTSAQARRFAQVTASELRSVGINMNMAPVLDVVPAGFSGVMADRSFGSDPVQVSRLGRTIIAVFQENGILAVAKHFPGMGRAEKDPHAHATTLEASLSEMESSDLIPFKDAVAAGVSGVMLSHLIYKGLDPQWPASLSRGIASDLLQRRMGFPGIVFTDDLDMGAIEGHYPVELLAERILEARVDMALICHRSEKMESLFHNIRNAFEKSSRAKEGALAVFHKIAKIKRTRLRV